jgi:hypothetical protein
MGAGRSGSTILGVTLGNCGGVFYAGELDAWLVRSGSPVLEDAERARFWQGVCKEVDGAADLFGREAQRSIERSLALFRVHKWPTRRRIRERYRRISEDLYHAIARAAGVRYVVDTSHYPLRARELQQLEGVDLYLVYLVRNPQGVVASFNRRDVAQYSKSTITTNVYLWLTNLLSVFVFLSHRRDRRLVVQHEHFIANPVGTLCDILNLAGAPVELPDLTALRTGVPFQGNRLISSEVLSLEDSAGRPPRRSALTTVLQFPWALVLARLRPAALASGPRRDA